MPSTTPTPVTILGLGAMGQALAATLRKNDIPTTVWNRTPGKDTDLIAAGANSAATPRTAIEASPVVIVVLLDHASVHTILDPVVEQLAGRQVINLTSTTPEEARELASWAAGHGIDYLDGGIMAIPAMIGQPGAAIRYSGTQRVHDDNRAMLELLASAEYFGADAGIASTYDFALLSVMYGMFGGFLNGVAMLLSIGVSAQDFGVRAAAWATAMAAAMPMEGQIIDARAYSDGGQNIYFLEAAIDAIVRAGHDAKVSQEFLTPLQNVVNRQIADGHGELSVLHTVEAIV
ncbi:NAD(P)-dependent oxidoreductase [Nocardia cyriacigeorgica]|uniref:NAD(P)-dependent oxidoreductase n=1 Tax=Nocardia cyriacigeorgica TaxID=135487 RepID=UPI0024559C1E|nr:NAD(P)-binding domain-containing protein [Nocardia cyriacigeorgica]